MLSCQSLSYNNQRVIIRCDFNVPIGNAFDPNHPRIMAHLATIEHVLAAGASVLILSHLGQPTSNTDAKDFSLSQVAQALSEHLQRPVPLLETWPLGPSLVLRPGEVALAENTRLLAGEYTNCPQLACAMAQDCDIFIMDAFATAHREHASTTGLASHAPKVCAGFLFEQEIQALDTYLNSSHRPKVAIIGGAKGDDKITMLSTLISDLDYLALGGGIANSFLSVLGYEIGQSIHNPKQASTIQTIIQRAHGCGCTLILPTDVMVTDCDQPKLIDAVCSTDRIVDLGPQTVTTLCQVIQESASIFWNGPLGWFEHPSYAVATQTVADALAKSEANTLIGGGDTLAALSGRDCLNQMTYVSTGGGASLSYLQDKNLKIMTLLNNQENQRA